MFEHRDLNLHTAEQLKINTDKNISHSLCLFFYFPSLWVKSLFTPECTLKFASLVFSSLVFSDKNTHLAERAVR